MLTGWHADGISKKRKVFFAFSQSGTRQEKAKKAKKD